ncbi:hypothetical protein K2173_011421 [Erythroxylum novogranatense]|uniref:Myb/SANT-like domain-containing protein n=1 Tax=Erythroxylum novogranatense TaxID=1862640 RepID=A0AAV8S6Q3_9ROSI|nr:hypothetical protein K2173_011421 [Erythroxylum novogranatense]
MLELKESGKFDGENGSGLRKGYQKELERILDLKLPGHSLKEKPHIESCCKLLKKQYHAIYDARNSGETSGFGWDDEKKCVTADIDVWSAYLKTHPDNSFMRNRSFPYYDKLAIIWGQDRATGKNAEAPVDMLENIIREENLDEENEASNGEEDVEPRRDQPIRDNSQGEGSSKKTHRKRRRSTDSLVSCLERITEKLTEGFEKSNEQMAKVAESIIAPNQKESENRQKLDEELCKLTFLTQAERIRAGIKLVNNPNYLEYFFTLKDADKEEYLKQI